MRRLIVVVIVVVSCLWPEPLTGRAMFQAQSCAPSIFAIATALAQDGSEVIARPVDVSANASVPGCNRLTGITFTRVENGVIEVDGVPRPMPLAMTFTPPMPA
jgi:hypothetical protein